MDKLREYLEILDKIGELFDDLPTLDFDEEIETFYEKTIDLIVNHQIKIEKRLKNEENKLLKEVC